MLAGHHCFFNRSGVKAVAFVGALLLLSGCSMQSSRMALLENGVQTDDSMSGEVSAGQAEVKVLENVEPTESVDSRSVVARGHSEWCRYLREDAAAEASVVRSPSLNGSLDDGGRASLGVGLSLTSAMKADLIETTAEAKCRRYLAEKGLQSIILSSPQGLSHAGFRAKANAILGHEAEIRSLQVSVRQALADGAIDQQQSSAMLLLADQIIADGLQARSQAEMRSDTLQSNKGNVAALSAELAKAEAEISESDSKMRTYDAMDLSLRAGWNDDVTDNGAQIRNDDLSGKVTFSMKLGALLPSRFEHERVAAAAKISALRGEEGGTIWQASALRSAYERSIVGLQESRAKLNEALNRTRSFERQISAENSPEFVAQQAGARLQIIRLSAEQEAIDATISETQATLQKLGNG